MRSRRGFTLLECGIAGAVLLAMMGVCVQFATLMAQQRRAVAWRAMAACAAANLLERLAAAPWDTLEKTPVELSADARQTLPKGAARVEVSPLAGPPEAKRVAVVVSWRPAADGEPESVQLVAWRHRRP